MMRSLRYLAHARGKTLNVDTKTYNREPAIRLHAFGGKRKMAKKRNVVLYLDAELVRKPLELGFNLSKTCENHLKTLITQFSDIYSVDNSENNIIIGSPGY